VLSVEHEPFGRLLVNPNQLGTVSPVFFFQLGYHRGLSQSNPVAQIVKTFE